jgi:hypothetical protein
VTYNVYYVDFKEGQIASVTEIQRTMVTDCEYTCNKTTGIIIDAHIKAANRPAAKEKARVLAQRILDAHRGGVAEH